MLKHSKPAQDLESNGLEMVLGEQPSSIATGILINQQTLGTETTTSRHTEDSLLAGIAFY